jgi:hypothetical protein
MDYSRSKIPTLSKTAYQTPAPEITAASSNSQNRPNAVHCRQSNFFARLCKPFSNMSWRSGLYAEFHASLIVLHSNFVLIFTGLLA